MVVVVVVVADCALGAERAPLVVVVAPWLTEARPLPRPLVRPLARPLAVVVVVVVVVVAGGALDAARALVSIGGAS